MQRNWLYSRNQQESNERIDDTFNNGDYAGLEIHEHPILNGSIGTIKGKILHKEDKGIEHYIKKHNEYSSWEVRRYNLLKQSAMGQLSFRQKVKYRLLNTWFLGFFYFVYLYIFKLGFLDGKEGFMLASLKKQYFFNIKLKLEELKKETSKL